jgi:arylsulfatase A-like enzyme
VPETVRHYSTPVGAGQKGAQAITFDLGCEFIHTNHQQQNWFLQIETFDPHEPFFTHSKYKALYPHSYDGPHFDWPDYKRVTESDEQVEHVRLEYAALVSMCDRHLGRVLDRDESHKVIPGKVSESRTGQCITEFHLTPSRAREG